MMATEDKAYNAKCAILADAAKVAEHSRSAGAPSVPQVEALLAVYYRHVATEDLAQRDPVDVYGAARSHYRLAANRPQGSVAVNVFTPTVGTHGWWCTHTVVEVVTDDMPFLVDSVTMELSRQDRGIHVVVHPQLTVRRDVTGRLLEIVGNYDGYTTSQAGRQAPRDALQESWIHVEIDRDTDPAALVRIETDLRRVLSDVREAVEDWPKLRARALEVVDELANSSARYPLKQEIADARELLSWLAEDHFTFLGYREYTLVEEEDDTILRAVPGTGLGILRSDPRTAKAFSQMPPDVRAKAREKKLLILTKANSRSTVHRPAYLDYIGIKTFDETGEVTGERRFLGLFTSAAYTQSVAQIPVLRRKAVEVIRRSGFSPDSHSGKALQDIFETFPREELFQASTEQLLPTLLDVLNLQERRQLRLFVRRDDYGRYLSCLVYLPQDRSSTQVRLKIQDILLEAYHGESVDFAVRVSGSVLGRLYVVVRLAGGTSIPEIDVAELEQKLIDATRVWVDDLADALDGQVGEGEAARLYRKYAHAFPAAYRDDFSARTAVADLRHIEELPPEGGLAMSLYEPVDAAPHERRFKLYRSGSPLSLSDVLPRLSCMGVEVIDERPYVIEKSDGTKAWICDFGLVCADEVGVPASQLRELFQDAFAAVWSGRVESDGLNALVLRAGLTWRQASILRAYAKYLRQAVSTFSQYYIEASLMANDDLARLLVELFQTRFDTTLGLEPAERKAQSDGVVARIEHVLDEVASLDQDRIIRSFLRLIQTTLRTNYFQVDAEGRPKPYLSFKLDPLANPELPQPRPKFEVWVYSPRVEGVHLRFGPVARGGVRWSDRREDFRAEVLGLAKAEMVKNALIVPVGAKGGFYCKQLPDPADRDAWLNEGIACYKTFICGLLDVTDNLRRGEVVPPSDVVRYDGDDAYLVVAADKGTATFSDIANEVANSYGFWLGDAFASGGSDGYDHKAMGITAKGAWESVKRHFREMGRDCQTQGFTCVGIGDMSSDVFGNGMLASQHTKLVAAFDHRHVFVDPDPPETSYAERQRLLELPRSSWADYNRDLISAGGGVFRRSAKSVRITDQMRAALGIDQDVEALTPNELIRAILTAPVDLLWNGGIGTYVKATSESHADVGDKANDGARVNGADLRCACVGEGGNLGLTQLGRIEYATRGGPDSEDVHAQGRINTDFIDNSAGVDTCDHEVNIKILLDRLVAEGDLTRKQRNQTLAAMTDEVASLVLHDNYQQNVALSNAAVAAPAQLHVQAAWVRQLEELKLLDRKLEPLPSPKQFRERNAQGRVLATPELAVLLAYTKIAITDELLGSTLPDDAYLQAVLADYFPTAIRERFATSMDSHPLRREIITSQVVNQMINIAGIAYYPWLSLETGAPAEQLTRAHIVARQIYGVDQAFDEIRSLDNKIDAKIQVNMRLDARRIAERASRWLVQNRRQPIDITTTIDFFAEGMQKLIRALPGVLIGREQALFEGRRDAFIAAGVPKELAVTVAAFPLAYAGLGISETAAHTGADVLDVARVHFTLGERLELGGLLKRILALPQQDRWQTTARGTLCDDLHSVHAQLTRDVLAVGPAGTDAVERVAAWEQRDPGLVSRTRATIAEIVQGDTSDLAGLSVALRLVRRLLRTAR